LDKILVRSSLSVTVVADRQGGLKAVQPAQYSAKDKEKEVWFKGTAQKVTLALGKIIRGSVSVR